MTRLLPLLIAASLICSSCVYFNTYYNAEKYFKLARNKQINRMKSAGDSAAVVTKDEEETYNKSIEKCSKVLKLYPQDRKYNAKSTLLLAEIFYYMGRYPESIRKCNEFLSNYPEEKGGGQALYIKGMCCFKQEEYDKSVSEFEAVIQKTRSPSLKTRSQYMLAEIALLKGSSFQAIDRLKKMEGGGAVFQSLINFKMGNLLFLQKQYMEAYGYFIKVEKGRFNRTLPELSMPENLKYEADILAGRCLKEAGEYKRAIAHFRSLLDNDAYFRHFGEIYLRLAQSLAALGELKEAEKIYLKINQDYPRTAVSAAACYQLGLLNESTLQNIAEAFSWYKKATVEFANCEEAALAKKRYDSLKSIFFLQADPDSLLSRDTTLTKADSALIDSIRKMGPAARHFRVAEVFLFELTLADSAMAQYRAIARLLPPTDSADTVGYDESHQKALFAMAWIMDNLKNDSARSDTLYRAIIDSFPATEYAKAAQAALGERVTLMTRRDSVTGRFLRAESLYTYSNDVRGAVKGMAAFYTECPSDTLAPKALIIAGWLSEDRLADTADAAMYYTVLHEKFSETEYGKFARRKLEGRKKELEEIFVDKPGQGAEGTVLDEKTAQKISTLSVNTEEASDEGSWVNLKEMKAVAGKLEGPLRSKEVVDQEVLPAVESIDEIYIDMIEESLSEEGELYVDVVIKKNGEIAKVRFDKDKSTLSDKPMLQEIEKILYGMVFEENAPDDITLQLHLTFENKNKEKKSADEE